MKQISFVLPARENLKYLKWAYASIRKNADLNHWICLADDASTDGTWNWIIETMKKDKYVKAIKNSGPERKGHTILYDQIIEELVETDIFIIYHSDMYLAPGSIERVLKTIKPKTIVSMTRIEPPLHPPGPEKIVFDFGTEPEKFDETGFLKYVELKRKEYKKKTTQGMFAPWAMYKSDFLAINGHDPLYAPQSREDSDIFNRFLLAGYEPIQLWDALVYHMTCRGSRFNPKLTQVGTASMEWLAHNRKSERNFTRKWGNMVKVDENLKPIIPHKYDISFVVKNCTFELLDALEPWCSRIYCDVNNDEIVRYINSELWSTMYNLGERIFHIQDVSENYKGDIIIEFDGRRLNQNTFKTFITQVSSILDHIDEPGTFEYDIFDVTINELNYYEDELIVCDKIKKVR